MSKTRFCVTGVLCVALGLLAGEGGEDESVDHKRKLALDTVLDSPTINVHVSRNNIKVGEKVTVRAFISAEHGIPAPGVFRYPVVRVGFYHRRLKKTVYSNRVKEFIQPRFAFSTPLPVARLVDHPSYDYFTDERRGFEDDCVPRRPGVYLIFAEWSVDHPRWGKVLLRGGPAVLVVEPPHYGNPDDTTDPRFCSGPTRKLPKGQIDFAAPRQDELEDLYDRRSRTWEEHSNQWKR